MGRIEKSSRTNGEARPPSEQFAENYAIFSDNALRILKARVNQGLGHDHLRDRRESGRRGDILVIYQIIVTLSTRHILLNIIQERLVAASARVGVREDGYDERSPTFMSCWTGCATPLRRPMS